MEVCDCESDHCLFVSMQPIQGHQKQLSVGAVMVCARSARKFFYVILIIHEQSRTYYGV